MDGGCDVHSSVLEVFLAMFKSSFSSIENQPLIVDMLCWCDRTVWVGMDSDVQPVALKYCTGHSGIQYDTVNRVF